MLYQIGARSQQKRCGKFICNMYLWIHEHWTRTQLRTLWHIECIEYVEIFLLVAFSLSPIPLKAILSTFFLIQCDRDVRKRKEEIESYVTTIVTSFAHSSFASSILTHDLAYFHTASFRSHYMTSVLGEYVFILGSEPSKNMIV